MVAEAMPVVIMRSLQEPHLIFHRYLGRWGRPEDPDLRLNGAGFTNKPIQVLSATICGLPVFYCTYDVEHKEHNQDGRMRGTLIRYSHAVRIAQPCRKCFPNHPRVYRSYDEYLNEVRPDDEESS